MEQSECVNQELGHSEMSTSHSYCLIMQNVVAISVMSVYVQMGFSYKPNGLLCEPNDKVGGLQNSGISLTSPQA